MAKSRAVPHGHVRMIAEVLSDQRIEELLQEAESRLQKPAVILSPAELPDQPVFKSEATETQKRKPIPRLQHGFTQPSYIQECNGVAKVDSRFVVGKEQSKLADHLRPNHQGAQSKKMNDVLTAGPDWFDLPKTTMSSQLKRDLQMIEMRSVLDPHRHYKKNARRGKVPTFSQTGTVIEGPTEWYSSRINKKDRAKNFVEEVMTTETKTGRFQRKYEDIQGTKTSGKKAHYKKLMQKRKKTG